MAKKLPSNGYLLGLDVGSKRIGVALSSVIAQLPRPYGDIQHDEQVTQSIQDIVLKESVTLLIIGLPRNLNGEETAQTQSIRQFGETLSTQIEVPIVYVDESLSSVRADGVMNDNQFKGASRDALAACFILEEYINTAIVAEGERNEL